MKLLDTKADHDIKNDIQRFLDGDYLGRFTKEENDFGLKMSFLFNHSKIQNGDLIFTYGKTSLKIKIDTNMPNAREAHFGFIMKDDFFQSSLKSFIRENKINKIIND
jgi:hypothetical protein